MKILHWPGQISVFLIATLLNLIFIVIGLFHLYKISRISTQQKLLWMLGFFFLSWITGLLYYSRLNKK